MHLVAEAVLGAEGNHVAGFDRGQGGIVRGKRIYDLVEAMHECAP